MKAFAILPALALAACAATTPPLHTTGTPTAGLGQTANVDSLLVTPIAIVEDSRCPIIAQCVWAGRLVVRTEVRAGSWTKTLDLTLGAGQHVADGEIRLENAVPDKNSKTPVKPSDYRFTYSFSGGLWDN
nr:hypothetical protein [uncultured Sphingomonas sp.]